jgi:hypothetical protein
MRPHLVRDEQELKRKLIPRNQWSRFRFRHNLDDLLRADIKTRYEAYKTAIMSGFKTQNEVRKVEGLPPMPGGDTLLKPEAIFGKSGGSSKPAAPSKEKKSRSPDKRLLALTTQAVRGMISREITHAERCASRPTDFVREVNELYEKHLAIADEKFSPFGLRAAAMRSALQKHRDELLVLKDSRVLSADVPALTNRWMDDAEQLARRLLGEE